MLVLYIITKRLAHGFIDCKKRTVEFCLQGFCWRRLRSCRPPPPPPSPRVDWASQLCFINLHPLIENSPDEERYSGLYLEYATHYLPRCLCGLTALSSHVQVLHANQRMGRVPDDWEKDGERERENYSEGCQCVWPRPGNTLNLRLCVQKHHASWNLDPQTFQVDLEYLKIII